MKNIFSKTKKERSYRLALNLMYRSLADIISKIFNLPDDTSYASITPRERLEISLRKAANLYRMGMKMTETIQELELRISVLESCAYAKEIELREPHGPTLRAIVTELEKLYDLPQEKMEADPVNKLAVTLERVYVVSTTEGEI